MHPVAVAAENAEQTLLQADAANLADHLNAAVRQFAGWPYCAASGRIIDADGQTAGPFSSVIHATKRECGSDLNAIPSDSAAAVIDAYETADLDVLRGAYLRVSQAKRLTKAPVPQSEVPITTVTLGIIFALRSSIPLEVLAGELQKLNLGTPAKEWPDVVVIADTGTINYAAQFPGSAERCTFLPPAAGALDKYIPPMYVGMVMNATGAHAFGQMTAIMVAHLSIFSPGANVPNFNQVLEAVPKTTVMFTGYQYDLRGEIKPVPRKFYNDRYLPPLPMRIEDQKGQLLSTIQFLPWQDGGVLLLKGKLPLDGLMVLLGGEALAKAGVIRLPLDLQLSYVLPITPAGFAEMLNRLKRQSNVIVRRTEPSWTVQTFAEEGSSSPFMARLFAGIMRLRDVVYPDPGSRDGFDKSFEFVISSLMSARSTAKEIAILWTEHIEAVRSGAIARLKGKSIHVDKNLDRELRKQVESFLNAAVRTLKQGMQDLAKVQGADVGFLFKQQKTFDAGIAALETTDPLLADYLRNTRTWSEPLVERRNAIEHEGWTLPRIIYSQRGSGIDATVPEISRQPFNVFIDFMLDRLCCFTEELIAHGLQNQMPRELTITELPFADREKEMPQRFRLTLGTGGLPSLEHYLPQLAV